MPLLRQAKRITVLTVQRGTVPGPSAAELARNLQRHGLSVEWREVAPRATRHRRGHPARGHSLRRRPDHQGRLYPEPAAADDLRRGHQPHPGRGRAAGDHGQLTAAPEPSACPSASPCTRWPPPSGSAACSSPMSCCGRAWPSWPRPTACGCGTRVFGRFFPIVLGCIAVLLLTGYHMLFAGFGGFGGAGVHVHIMHLTGWVMFLLFFHLYFAPWRRYRRAVAAGEIDSRRPAARHDPRWSSRSTSSWACSPSRSGPAAATGADRPCRGVARGRALRSLALASALILQGGVPAHAQSDPAPQSVEELKAALADLRRRLAEQQGDGARAGGGRETACRAATGRPLGGGNRRLAPRARQPAGGA